MQNMQSEKWLDSLKALKPTSEYSTKSSWGPGLGEDLVGSSHKLQILDGTLATLQQGLTLISVISGGDGDTAFLCRIIILVSTSCTATHRINMIHFVTRKTTHFRELPLICGGGMNEGIPHYTLLLHNKCL